MISYQLNMNRVKPQELWEVLRVKYNAYPAHASFGGVKKKESGFSW
jgi:hypothetical protein